MRVDIPLESNYDSTRLPASLQQTKNLYPHTTRGYRQTPGMSVFTDFLSGTEALTDSNAAVITDSEGDALLISVTSGGNDRGMIEAGPGGLAYIVSGTELYSIDSTGASLNIGTISGTTNAVMDTDGTQLIICAGATPYVYTVASGLLTITSPEVATSKTVAWIDNRFIYDRDSGQAIASELGDGTTISALSFVTAESNPDDSLRVYALNQLLYIFGERSIEAWFTSGVGQFPLSRQAVIEHGISGRYACSSIDDTLYFIGNNRRPSIMEGLLYAPIYTPGVASAWDTYAEASFTNARVSAYSFQQENFVDFVFADQNKVWTYHEASKTLLEQEFQASTVINAFNKTLANHPTNGKLYTLDTDIYQIDSQDFMRIKDIPLITGEFLGAPGADIVITCMRLHFQTSSLATVNISFSKDLITFSTPIAKTINGIQTVELYRIGRCREIVFRIETNTNAAVQLLDASADIQALAS